MPPPLPRAVEVHAADILKLTVSMAISQPRAVDALSAMVPKATKTVPLSSNSAARCLRSAERKFWIGLPWQGQGLMSEAVDAVNAYWFEELKMPVLRSPKAIVNTPSRRISEKTGMRLIAVEERDSVSGPLPTEIWEITAEEWRAHRRNRSRQ